MFDMFGDMFGDICSQWIPNMAILCHSMAMYWEYEGFKMYLMDFKWCFLQTNNRDFTGNDGLSSGTYGD